MRLIHQLNFAVEDIARAHIESISSLLEKLNMKASREWKVFSFARFVVQRRFSRISNLRSHKKLKLDCEVVTLNERETALEMIMQLLF